MPDIGTRGSIVQLDQNLQNKYKQEILDALDKGQIGETAGQIIGAAVALVAAVVFAPATGGQSLWWWFTYYVAAASIGAAIGGVIDPPAVPEVDFGYGGLGSAEGGSRYGFGVLSNTWTNEIPIPVGYGELKLAGNIIYQSEPGETVYRCICLCEGEIEEIATVKINDIDITDLDGCSYDAYLGTSTQTVDSRFSSDVDGLRYMAYIAVTLKTSEQLTGGNPTITCIAKMRKISTWDGSSWSASETYSRNPVACLRDLLTNVRYGAGMPTAAIDATTWGSAYDYCEEQVQNITATGTEVRARLDYMVDGKRAILDVINSILSTFNGYLVFSGSKIKLKIEKDESVAQAFDMSNIIRGSFTYSKESKDNLPNRVKIQYIDPDYNYTKIFAQADNPVDQANRRTIGLGEDIVTKELALYGITRFSQASRQARLFLNISRACGTYCVFTVGPDALAAEVGDVITITHDVAKWATKKFRILGIGATKDDKLALLCREHDSSIYTGYSSGNMTPDYGTVADEKTAPNSVRQFTATQDINIVRFRWVAPIPKFNVVIDSYEIRQGGSWSTGSLVAIGLTGTTYETGDFPLGLLTFWIKAVSTEGVYSTSAISDSITSTIPANYNAVFSHDEWDPENYKDKTLSSGLEEVWSLDKSSSYWNKVIGLKNTTYIWDIATTFWDSDTRIWDEGPFPTTEQTYTTDEIDIGSEQTAPITINYDVYSYAEVGSAVVDWRYKTETGSYIPWTLFATGEYTLRYCQFRIKLTAGNSDDYMRFFNFKVRIDVVDIIDRGTATIINASAGIVITYNQTYTTTPRITVSTRGASPYNPLITASSKDTFTIKLRDPETIAYKTGVVDWHTIGY